MVVGVVVLVVVAECLGAYFLLPSASPTEAHAAPETTPEKHEKEKPEKEKGEKEKGEKHAKGPELKTELSSSEQVEADLGQFTIMAFQPVSGTTLRITVHIFGVVSQSETESFAMRMKEIQHRFRDQVIVTFRGAEPNDLADAGLGLLKRTILEKTNTMLGKPLLKMVIFSDFSFVELR
jgi:flagellar FliL protein